MRKPIIAASLAVVGTFATGYVVGQLGGASPTFAAGKIHQKATKNKLTAKQVATPTTSTAPTRSATPHADGQITSISGDTITVKADTDRAGSAEYTGVTTVTFTGSTTYEAGHHATATTTRPTLAVGQYIMAEGTVSADGTSLTASLVSTHAGGSGGGGPHHASGPHADGTVTAVSGDTITVKADTDMAGTTEYSAVTTISITSTTQFDAGHDVAATTTRPTITVGQHIVAEGTVSSDGTTLTATQVSVGDGGPGGH